MSSDPGPPGGADRPDPSPEPDPALDFDPYRFGAPEHPVPPEYAPPGYRPPAAAAQPPPPPPGYPPQQGPYGPYQAPGAYGQPQYPGQYGQQPGYPPPPYAGQYAPPPAGTGKAVAALVLGIASIVLCWLSVFDAVPIILAIVFGTLAMSEARRRPNREGHRLALAGVICAIVGAIAATVLTVWLYSRVHECLDYSTGSSAYTHCLDERLP